MKRRTRSMILGLLVLFVLSSFALPADSQEVRRRVMLPAAAGPPLTGLKLWLKAGDVSGVDGDPVATWPDASGESNNATQATAGNRPTLKTNIINGLPVVRFLGTATLGNNDGHLNLPDFCSSFTAGEVLILAKRVEDPPVDQFNSGLWLFGTSGNSTHVPFTDGTIYDGWGTSVRKTVGNATPSLTSWFIYDIASASGEWTARVNNNILFTTATNTVGFSTAPVLGGYPPGAYYLQGDVAEMLVYDHALSAGERAALVAYINAKYGLSF